MLILANVMPLYLFEHSKYFLTRNLIHQSHTFIRCFITFTHTHSPIWSTGVTVGATVVGGYFGKVSFGTGGVRDGFTNVLTGG